MASKPNTSRQHKHFAVLIDADNAPAAIVEGLFETNEAMEKFRLFHPTHIRTTYCH